MGTSLFSDVTPAQEKMLDQLPPDQRTAIEGKMKDSNELEEDIEKALEDESFLVERPKLKEEDKLNPIKAQLNP